MQRFSYSLGLLLLGTLFFLHSCKTTTANNDSYFAEIEQWKAKRFGSLSSATGWTTVIGLFKIKEGLNQFGSGHNMDLRFPEGTPEKMGKIRLQGDTLQLEVQEGVELSVDDQPAKTAILATDLSGKPTMMKSQSLNWFVLKRKDQYLLRLRDTLAPARKALKPIPHYPIDPAWNIPAHFKAVNTDRKVTMENVLGMMIEYPVAGIIEFSHQDQAHELLALDGGPEELFMIFADETTGGETYGGGRYMYIPRPDENGQTHLDFNKAYNPPCNFTKYATCLLPASENHLPFEIKAGEKTYADH